MLLSRQKIEREIIQGIYKIENTKTHKVYIGQSIDIYRRWEDHKSALERNGHHARKLQNSYNRTKDKSVFEYSIIEVVENKEDLDDREKYYIDKYNSLYDGYNSADVGGISKGVIKKKIDKIKQRYYYSTFANLYNPDIIRFSKRWLERLEPEKMRYSWSVMRRLCIVLKWFYDNYYNSDNTLMLRITISYNNCFVARIKNEEKEIEAYMFRSFNNKYLPVHNWITDKPVPKEELKRWIFDFEEIDKKLENIIKEKNK